MMSNALHLRSLNSSSSETVHHSTILQIEIFCFYSPELLFFFGAQDCVVAWFATANASFDER